MWTPPAPLIGCTVFAAAGWAMTRPEEFRSHRMLRISTSLPLVWLVTHTLSQPALNIANSVGGMAIFWSIIAVAGLAFLWSDVVGALVARVFAQMVHGDGNVRTGVRPDFRAAKCFRSHGELLEAMAELKAELRHDPINYEGLLLLADLHSELGAPRKALHVLEQLSNSKELTADQRTMVLTRRRDIEARSLMEEANHR